MTSRAGDRQGLRCFLRGGPAAFVANMGVESTSNYEFAAPAIDWSIGRSKLRRR